MSKTNLTAVFAQLRLAMLTAAPSMLSTMDRPGILEMNAPWPHPAKPDSPMWFGAVRTGKSYVSYHLMPVYSHPELAKKIPPRLRKRMQGKSCFNFTSLEPGLLAELEAVTIEAARLYAKPFPMPARQKRKPGRDNRR